VLDAGAPEHWPASEVRRNHVLGVARTLSPRPTCPAADEAKQ
jgi:hypothetical protein